MGDFTSWQKVDILKVIANHIDRINQVQSLPDGNYTVSQFARAVDALYCTLSFLDGMNITPPPKKIRDADQWYKSILNYYAEMMQGLKKSDLLVNWQLTGKIGGED